MQHILDNVLTEDRVERLLSGFMPKEEDFTFIGQAFHRLLDTNYYDKTYYVGKTEKTGIIAPYWVTGFKKPTIMPLQAFEEYVRGKGIEVFPFLTPPLAGAKDWAIFQGLKETVDKHLAPEENPHDLVQSL